jgi:type IV pilus assembly protein PilE
MKNKGFTLVELLSAMVIIAILASIAIPSYRASVLKSGRSDGKAALADLQLKMEKFRGSCPTFPTSVGSADNCSTGVIKFDSTSNEGNYTISIVSASSTGNAYRIKAVATGGQADDSSCTPLTITMNNTNPKGLRQPADCW